MDGELDLVQRVHLAHQGFLETFARHVPTSFIERSGGVALYASGRPLDGFNTIFANAGSTEGDLRHVVDKLDDAGLPFALALSKRLSGNVTQMAQAVGFEHDTATKTHVMATTAGARLAPPAGLDVTWGSDAFGAHCEVTEAVFEMTRDEYESIMPHAVVAEPTVDVVVGSVDGRPVTTALSVEGGGGVGVFGVATVEDHRGNGYAGAMTSLVMQKAFAKGVGFATLRCKPEVVEVYERIGFETIDQSQRWIQPGSNSRD